MQTEINFYPYPVYVGASQTSTMNIHRHALAKWLLRAIFGALYAGGDATGGRSSNAGTDNGMEDPDEDPHPPLDELKRMCTAAWAKFPFKTDTNPFKAKAWQYFYPCDDVIVKEGEVRLPYDGYVKSIFLPDDQKRISRKCGVHVIV